MGVKKSIQLPDFSDLHIMVIGDVMIDRYISGTVKRISPEAPVPVVEMQHSDDRLGGAANVAINLYALGAKVSLLSVTGDDNDAVVLSTMLSDFKDLKNLVMRLPSRRTTVKTRIMSGNQHLLRIDKEDTFDINDRECEQILAQARSLLSQTKVDGIILQDYNKGMLTETLIHEIIKMANAQQIATFVDPKDKNFFGYKDCTLFKPNKKEAQKALGPYDAAKLDNLIRDKLNHKVTCITMGSEGMYLNDGITGDIYPTEQRIISDVCGAGDSVISILSLCYLKGFELEDMAIVANKAGGQVCEKPGVVAVDLKALKNELRHNIEHETKF